MRKEKAASVWLFALCLLLTACQPTPEEEIVKQKSEALFVESITATAKPEKSFKMQVSQHITQDVETENAKIKISIDADVEMPDAEAYPIVKISKSEFSRETLKQVYTVLAHGTEEIEVFPRAFYQKDLDALLDLRDSGDLDKYGSLEELNEAIEAQQKKVAAAPEKTVTKEAVFNWTGDAAPLFFFISDAETQQVGCCNPAEEYYIECVGNMSEMKYLEAQVLYESSINYIQPRVEAGSIQLVMPKITEEEGKQKAEQLISDLGLSEDFVLAGSRTAVKSELYRGETGQAEAVHEYLFVRQIAGVPVTFFNVSMSSDAENPSSYAAPWYYEKIRIFADDSGILGFLWNGPCKVEEVVNRNARLLPFEEILETFERMVGYKYAGLQEDSLTEKSAVTVTRIQLGLVRVIEKNDLGTAYLVPAWTFFGLEIIDDWSSCGCDGFDPILILNALDGSVIDPKVGY